MANIPGIPGYVDLGAYSRVQTIPGSVSVPGGARQLCIMGEGRREELIVSSAIGSGEDGEAADFSTEDPDGRHFQLSLYPIISNRLDLYLNGSLLTGTEDEVINSGAFTPGIDYRLNITTGRIELKNASLVDQSGTGAGVYWRTVTGITNTGSTNPTDIELLDDSAPEERWTLRCIDVQEDGYGNRMPGTAIFSVTGSVTGAVRSEVTGQPILWRSDGAPSTTAGARLVENSNRLAITDTTFDLPALTIYEHYSLVVVTDAGSQNGTYIAYEVDLDGFDASTEQSILLRNTDGTTPTFTADASVSVEIITANSILAFVMDDTGVGDTVFAVGDRFVIEVESGVLQARDQLSAKYIATIDVEDPEYFVSAEKLYTKHGYPESGNTIAIGAQLAFANQAPGLWAIQCKPPLPRRTTETVLAADDLTTSATEGASGNSALSDLMFEIEFPGQPDGDTEVLIFVVDTDGTETQIFPKKWAFYDSALDSNAAKREWTGVTVGAGTQTNSYTVVNEEEDLGNNFTRDVAYLMITKDLALDEGQGLKIIYIDEKDANYFDAYWSSALENLETVDLYMIAPLPQLAYNSVFRSVLAHVESMSSTLNRHERIMLFGAIPDVTIDALMGRELVAVEDIGVIEGVQGDDVEEVLNGDIEDLQDYSMETNWGNSYRAVYFYPDEIVVPIAGQNTLMEGFYLSCAGGGWLAAQGSVALPLSRKTLAGFTITRDNLPTQSQINDLGSVGVTLVTPVLGGGKVRHGQTTTSSGTPEEEEISIVSIRDYIAKVTRQVLENRFVGTVENPTTAAAINNITTLTLSSFLTQGLITQFTGVNVSRDDVEPRQWNVSFAIQPAYPVNWIFIDISVGVLG